MTDIHSGEKFEGYDKLLELFKDRDASKDCIYLQTSDPVLQDKLDHMIEMQESQTKVNELARKLSMLARPGVVLIVGDSISASILERIKADHISQEVVLVDTKLNGSVEDILQQLKEGKALKSGYLGPPEEKDKPFIIEDRDITPIMRFEPEINRHTNSYTKQQNKYRARNFKR